MIRKIDSSSNKEGEKILSISAKDMDYNYGSQLAISPFSFKISLWERILISWPSGSWKTTLLKLIWGVLQPTSWKIQIGNLSEIELQKERFHIFGYAFVDGDFFESMSVRDNILIFSETLSLQIDKDWYKELLAYFEMEGFEHVSLQKLSAGQRERINLIRAFVHKPKILLLDEPGSHLDKLLQKKLIEFITRYQKVHNATLIVSSHGGFDPAFFDTFFDFHEDHHLSLRASENSHQ